MNRKPRIASALALAGFLSVLAPVTASAGTPLLSGYGGPGAGEQAIVGSTLLGGVRGGGSGGSASSGGSGNSGLATSGGTSGGTSTSGSIAGSSRSDGSHASGTSVGSSKGRRPGGPHGAGVGGAGAPVYPSSPPSSDSRLIGISAGDVLPIVGIVVALTLVGVFTVRFVRLQP